MTPSEVEFLVQEIASYDRIGDDEAAHALEDALYQRVVSTLAGMIDNTTFTYFDLAELVECARIAFKTRDMKFYRWCG